ncbi:hypothetical protein B4168_1445 [Anoxybacillus flavithermus]|nr:hypothetical protein B4168_1445 [Anoxybacillus flavithermus]OAO84103.1 hypothetical protein GT23_3638 [Parageobacillus thermoglucosidasius]
MKTILVAMTFWCHTIIFLVSFVCFHIFLVLYSAIGIK